MGSIVDSLNERIDIEVLKPPKVRGELAAGFHRIAQQRFGAQFDPELQQHKGA
jgi:hypothetical protein